MSSIILVGWPSLLFNLRFSLQSFCFIFNPDQVFFGLPPLIYGPEPLLVIVTLLS